MQVIWLWRLNLILLSTNKGEPMYLVIDIAGRYLTESGFNSYVHHDATKFSHKEAVLLAKRHNADIQELWESQ